MLLCRNALAHRVQSARLTIPFRGFRYQNCRFIYLIKLKWSIQDFIAFNFKFSICWQYAGDIESPTALTSLSLHSHSLLFPSSLYYQWNLENDARNACKYVYLICKVACTNVHYNMCVLIKYFAHQNISQMPYILYSMQHPFKLLLINFGSCIKCAAACA